ncbi:uncharacterized protein LOC130666183 [Microplitis mediator]|uniref:uncharacterized protein LOC130666183 n=1 Tax=Microplitis mediator TaxID=375433 RepID=UPI002553CAF0|nr:uncharacterized protein LOC130666183 [Microplitis mediator]
MNGNQSCISNTKVNRISNTDINLNNGFTCDKYDPYVDVLRTLFVPSVDKRICELLELFVCDKKDTPTYWERCLNIVGTIKYEVGVVQNCLKQVFYYFVNNGLVNCVINTLVLSNRLNKVCRDLDTLGEKNILRYANAVSYVTEKNYWRLSKNSASIASRVEVEVGSTLAASPNSSSTPRDSDAKYPKRSSKRRSSNFEKSSDRSSCSCSCSNGELQENCEESDPSNDGKNLMVLIGDPRNSKYSKKRKSSVPCKCENLIRHFVKNDMSESPLSVKAKNKLERALKSTCFSLNEILEPMDAKNLNKCRLLCKLQENYVKIQLKKQDTDGNKTCLYTERIDFSKNDSGSVANLDNIPEEKPIENNCQLIDDNFDVNESDLKGSKIVTSTKIYDTSVRKSRNECISIKNCGNVHGDLCKCRGQCFCDLDSFDGDNFITARTSVKSLDESSVMCDSEHSCSCSLGTSVSIDSVIENKNFSAGNKKNCCSSGKENCEENKEMSKDSNIDIYINISENDGNVISKNSDDCKVMKSISVQTIGENFEKCCDGIGDKEKVSDKKSEECEEKLFPVDSVVFEVLKTIEENCDCNEKEDLEGASDDETGGVMECAEKPEGKTGENISECEEKSSKENLEKNESRKQISEGHVKKIVDKIEGNNWDCNCSSCSLEENDEKSELDCICSTCSVDEKLNGKPGEKNGQVSEKHEMGCNCSLCSLEETKLENENIKKEPSVLFEIKSEKESKEKGEIAKEIEGNLKNKFEVECSCSSESFQVEKMREEFVENNKKNSEKSIKEIVADKIEKPVKLTQVDKKEVTIDDNREMNVEVCACSVNSADVFTSAHSALTREPEAFETGAKVGDCGVDCDTNLCSIGENLNSDSIKIEENPKTECSESKPKKTASNSGKIKQNLKIKEESDENPTAEKIVVKTKRKRSDSSVKVKSLEIETPRTRRSNKNSAPESRRSVRSVNISKTSRASFSPAEADCGSSSYYRSNFSLHNFYFNCDCNETRNFSKKVSAPKNHPRANHSQKNYQSIHFDKLQRHESRQRTNVRAIISAVCRNFRHVFSRETLQKLKHIFHVKIYRLLKERDKSTSTADLPYYSRHHNHRPHHHHHNKNNSKKILTNEFSSDYENLCPVHKKAQILYDRKKASRNNSSNFQKKSAIENSCPYLDSNSSSKHHKELINHSKLRCHCNDLVKKSSQFECDNKYDVLKKINYHYYLKKRLSESSLSTYSQVSPLNYPNSNKKKVSMSMPMDPENSSQESQCQCYKKMIAAKHLAEYLQSRSRYRRKSNYENDRGHHNCCGSLDDIKLLHRYVNLNN